jgi:ATP-binding cassette, subfamily B, bacterial
MKLLINYLRKYKGVLTGALVLATINQVFSLLDTQIFRLIIDRYATRISEISGEDFIRGVTLLLLISVGAALISRIAKSFQDYYVNVVTQRVGTKMYADSVSHAFTLPYGVFEDQRSGEMLEKLQRARTDAQALIASAINVVFLFLIGVIFVLTYVFFVHWLIGLVLVLAIPFLGFTTFIISKKIKQAQKRIVKESTSLAGATTETLRNVELVKSLGLEAQETERLNKANEKILDLELVKVRLIRTLIFVQGTLINITRATILFLMLWLIFRGSITLGEFFAIMFYSFAIFAPLYELGSVVSQYQEAKASMESLDEILKMRPEPKPKDAKALNALNGINFKNVSFQYGSSDAPSIHGVSIDISAGETVAFVGPSGSGKTTLVKLLVGLYQPTKGELLINNIDVNKIDRDNFRRRIGYVSQETQLFAGTIKDNLLFVNPEATDEQCLEAMEAAAAMSIIDRGSGGLDTKIGEGGIKVSGGERQRLAIARALLRNPELIIFDEATSSLDSITEKSITETIQGINVLRPNLTTILVAHRLSTVSHADKICVLEKGKVIESGTHNKLLEKRGLYYALWREQSATDTEPSSTK